MLTEARLSGGRRQPPEPLGPRSAKTHDRRRKSDPPGDRSPCRGDRGGAAGPQRASPLAGGITESTRRLRRGRAGRPTDRPENDSDPRQIDAIWALWRISLDQAKAGNLEAARSTLREAARVETPPKADAQEVRARLAHGFVAARDFDEARKIAESLEPSSRAEILSKLARQKLRDGDLKWANFLVRRALKDADEFLNSPPPPRGPELPATRGCRGRGGAGEARRSRPEGEASGGGPIAARSDPCPGRRLGIGREGLRLHPAGGTFEEGLDSLLDLFSTFPFWRCCRRPGLGPLPLFPLAPRWALRGFAIALFDKEGAEKL